MTNLQLRIITGIGLGIGIISSVHFSPYSFIFLLFCINLFGLLEFYKLFLRFSPRKLNGVLMSASIYLSSSAFILNLTSWKIFLVNIPLAFFIFAIELYKDDENPFQSLAFSFLGIIYITIPSVLLLGIAFIPLGQVAYHPKLILGLFFIAWAHDSGAYFIGRSIGKIALFKSISPMKTWEGSIGGAFFALLTSYIVSLFFVELNMVNWLCIASIVILIGTYGDFIKSLIKRSVNVKDSGNILPGHGGILDRFDSILSSASFVLVYLLLFVKTG